MHARKPLVAMVVVFVAIGVGSAGSAAPALYAGPAPKLIPTPAQAGFGAVRVQPGGSTRASARYSTPGSSAGATMSLSVRVFPTEAAATASVRSTCPGCGPARTMGRGAWSARLRLDPGPPGARNKTTVVASCRNLRVETTSQPGGTDKNAVPARARRAIDAAIARAVGLGMSSSCAGTGGGTSAPETGTAFWTESDAEAAVVEKVKIPYCKIAPHDAECRQQAPVAVTKAECQGQDAKAGTATYARFTCALTVGPEARQARIVVLPTGASTFRWQAL